MSSTNIVFYICLIILAGLTILLFVNSCVPKEYYKYDTEPTLRIIGKGKWYNNDCVLYLSISNPTDQKLNKIVICYTKYTKSNQTYKALKLLPRSDIKIAITLNSNDAYTCILQNDYIIGTEK